MNGVFLFPYNPASAGAKELAQAMDIRRIKREGSKFKGDSSKVVINWGNSGRLSDEIMRSQVLNPAEVVGNVSNKRTFFEMLSDKPVNVPPWTTQRAEAESWFRERRCTIFARTKLTGHSGDGIVEVTTPQQLAQIPDGTLFVRYVPKKEEYRVHCTAKDGVIDVQRKARSWAVDNPNWRIRNHANGFIYARGNAAETPEVVKNEALKAFATSGLDFGGVDVLYNERHGVAYVLEINSAPGLEGTTVRKYATALDSMATDLRKKEV